MTTNMEDTKNMMRHCRLDDRHPNDTFAMMETDHFDNRCEHVMDVHLVPLDCCPVDARCDTYALEVQLCANFVDHAGVANCPPAATLA